MDKVQHKMIVGRTGSGKTYYAIAQMEKDPDPCLFVNVQEIDMSSMWVTATPDDELDSFVLAIEQGRKINFIPSADPDVARKEIETLWYYLVKENLSERLSGRLIFAIDECHLVAKQGKQSQVVQIALRGRSKAIEGWHISQRVAHMDKDIVTQVSEYIIFDHAAHDQLYLERLGIPAAQIVQQLRAAGEYHYMVYTAAGELRGPCIE